ncbi:MAG: cation-translocating P-type ATPase [Methanofollis sp.]|uniref:heavy metal translocating P-type ATPase n=1 Tax=Methanofollis sp. TaxID=2052835 RepID=UPI00262C4739|nr:cation-translocating P-type ATPase [Methanofollis sp.]MDD4255717.1 cation-translocating P-type ATPase [Methanofollis sp.]
MHGSEGGGCSCAACGPHHEEEEGHGRHEVALIAGAAVLLAAGLVVDGATPYGGAALMLFALAALAAGFDLLKSAIRSLLRLRFTMEVLIGIAAAGAFLIGHPAEGATVLVFFAAAELLEARAAERARRSVADLFSLAPVSALVRRDEGWTKLEVHEVGVGERVLVRPGDQVPLDGVVVSGASSVDQAALTGESVPAAKEIGDEVFAGTQNLEGSLEVEVTRPDTESTLARVAAYVEEAQQRRSRTERFIERFARVYTPAVIAGALAVTALLPLVFGIPFADSVYRALSLLVIACPCALALSTPVSMVSGITAAARQGILIKGSDYLEAVGRARVVVFDKTGTLTTGRLQVTAVKGSGDAGEREILHIAASLEAGSGHPIAAAVMAKAREAGVEAGPVEGFVAVPGSGVCGTLGGRACALGNGRLFPEVESAWEEEKGRLEAAGQTVVLVGDGGRVIGLIGLMDTIREDAAATVAGLRARGIRTVMLTGDNERVAAAVAGRLGIDEYRAGLLPAEKVQAVEDLTGRFGEVVMVGDGVNDAPALARAGVGIAMGAIGSDIAIETADVVLMHDRVAGIETLIDLSRKTMRVVRQNVAVSIAVKTGIAVLAVPGLVTLWMAVAIGDMGLSFAVIANALRIPWGRERSHPTPAETAENQTKPLAVHHDNTL